MMAKLRAAVDEALRDPGDPLYAVPMDDVPAVVAGLSLEEKRALYATNLAELRALEAAMEEMEEARRAILAKVTSEEDRPDPASPQFMALFAPLAARWANPAAAKRYAATSVPTVCGALNRRVRALGHALEDAYRADPASRPDEQRHAFAELERCGRELAEVSEDAHRWREKVRHAAGAAWVVREAEEAGRVRAAKLADIQKRQGEALAVARRFSWIEP